jgi:NAD+ synthase (glutamine-hydrolysing)
MPLLRIAIAQINPTVGDLSGNSDQLITYIRKATNLGVDLIAFPELAITGYPPEDLLLKKSFISDNISMANNVANKTKNIVAVYGFAENKDHKLYNSAAIATQGSILATQKKLHLPNYGVFDEKRYFASSKEQNIFNINNVNVGINICEDIWYKKPTRTLSNAGASIIININGSPFEKGKKEKRKNILTQQAIANNVYIAYINMFGGQDELVFDGGSLLIGPKGSILCESPQFREDFFIYDISITNNSIKETTKIKNFLIEGNSEKPPLINKVKPDCTLSKTEEILQALILGTRDYVLKNGFKSVLVALSGGIDSSVVTAIAVEALGAKNVTCLSMPSDFSSEGSKSDAIILCENLGIQLHTLPITEMFNSTYKTLAGIFYGNDPDVTEENIQSRIRGLLVMAVSNKHGHLVLTTGNKSETAVGYSTIYGDMAGGFSVIKDVPKTIVYQLAIHINTKTDKEIIPYSVISKAPSAELRPNQKDSDTLPEYAILDEIIELYVEKNMGYREIVATGLDPIIVSHIIDLINKNDYKRRQSAPGIKITQRSFDKDRRMPLTNKYTGYQ